MAEERRCKYPGCITLLPESTKDDYCWVHRKEGTELAKEPAPSERTVQDSRTREFITLKELAKELNYSTREIRKRLKDGRIQGRKLPGGGRKWIIPLKEVERLATEGLPFRVPPELPPSRQQEDERIIAELNSQPFVGRQRELEWLDGFLERHKRGYALVAGVPMSGKSSLLANWISRLRRNKSFILCHHFFSEKWRQDDISEFLVSMAQQLLNVCGDVSRSVGGETDARHIIYKKLKGFSHDEKLVLVVDAINEANDRHRPGFAVPYGVFPPSSELSDRTFVVGLPPLVVPVLTSLS